MKDIRVAIDGPAGAGKSTVAKVVAKKLGYRYIDTGAMYRAVTLKTLQSGIDLSDEDAVTQLASNIHIDFRMDKDSQLVFADGQDVTELIRSSQVTANVSQIAAIQGVRAEMTALQQKIARMHGVVMDGRDIGTHVIPDAEVKIFLTASLDERARRRAEELQASGLQVDMKQMQESISTRDQTDSSREFAPLRPAEDAYLLDSSGKTVDEVVQIILSVCESFIGTKP
jgi:cytidylate kinase